MQLWPLFGNTDFSIDLSGLDRPSVSRVCPYKYFFHLNLLVSRVALGASFETSQIGFFCRFQEQLVSLPLMLNEEQTRMKRLLPVLVDCCREGYTRRKFLGDVMAGVLVGIVALPLAIGFAIASGVRPEQGLITAILAGGAIALLGGSRTQVSGPTGAFVVVIFGIVQQFGYTGLACATLLASGMLALLALSGLGKLLHKIPDTLVLGFTAGIAVIILTSQMPHLLGLPSDKLPAEFFAKWQMILAQLPELNWQAAICGACAIVIMLIAPRFSRVLPPPLIAVTILTVLVAAFSLPVQTIGSRFGELPTTLPTPALPWSGGLSELPGLAVTLWYPALMIMLLGGIETLLSARVADQELPGEAKHRPDAELLALSVGNAISSVCGGIPATGAFARTATNIRSGGRTPVAAIVHALFLLAVFLWMGSLIAVVPMAALAGVLVMVAYHMGKWDYCFKAMRGSLKNTAVLVSTFVTTVTVDLIAGLAVGLVVHALCAGCARLFARRDPAGPSSS
jgi:SulP family sulfate permease